MAMALRYRRAHVPAPAGVRVVFEGDSLFFGYNAQVAPSTTFAAAYPDCTIFNVSEGGNSVVNMNDQAASEVDTKYQAGAVAILWGGTNDLTGFTAAQTYSQISDWCLGRRAVGFKTIVCNLIKNASLSGGAQTQLAILNASLASGHTFTDALVDLASVIDDWTTHPTWWDSDHVHLLTPGYTKVAELVGAAFDLIR